MSLLFEPSDLSSSLVISPSWLWSMMTSRAGRRKSLGLRKSNPICLQSSKTALISSCSVLYILKLAHQSTTANDSCPVKLMSQIFKSIKLIAVCSILTKSVCLCFDNNVSSSSKTAFSDSSYVIFKYKYGIMMS